MKKSGWLLMVLFLLLSLSLSLNFISSSLRVTEEHPFLIDGKWVSASDLKVGDNLQTIDGKKVRITNIRDVEVSEENKFPVYNLEAGKFHDFVVSDSSSGDNVSVVVHNSNKHLEDFVKQADYNQLLTSEGNYAYGLKSQGTASQSNIDNFVASIPDSSILSLENPLSIPVIKSFYDALPTTQGKEFFLAQLKTFSEKGFKFYVGPCETLGFVSPSRKLIGISDALDSNNLFGTEQFFDIFEHEYQHYFGFIRRNFINKGVDPGTIVSEAYFLPSRNQIQPLSVKDKVALTFKNSDPSEYFKIEDASLISLDEAQSDIYSYYTRQWLQYGRVEKPLDAVNLASLRFRSIDEHPNIANHGTVFKIGDTIVPRYDDRIAGSGAFTPWSPNLYSWQPKLDYFNDWN